MTDIPRSPIPGNRESQMQEAIEETRKTITGANPIVDPEAPTTPNGPNDGPELTRGAEPGAPGAQPKR
jgi:hypothetical protein